MNLFLALLLSSFGAESLKHTEEEEGPNKLQEAVDRINRFVIYVKSHATYCIKVKFKQKVDALHDCDSVGFTKHSGMGTTDGGIQFGNGHIRDRDETSTERLNNQDSPQHYNGLFHLFTPAMHVIYFSTILNSREVGLNLFIMILLFKRRTNWLIVREIQTIHSNDSFKWFIQTIHSNDSFKRFIQMIHSNDSFKRFIQMIHSNRGYSKDFFQLHKVHSKLSFEKLEGRTVAFRMIQTGQSPSKSTLSNLPGIYPDIYPQDFDADVRQLFSFLWEQ